MNKIINGILVLTLVLGFNSLEVKSATLNSYKDNLLFTQTGEITPIIPQVSPTIVPEVTNAPPEVSPIVTITPTISPTISVTPTATPKPTVTPKPTPFIPNTLKVMKEHNYVTESVTGVSRSRLSLTTLNKKLTKVGKVTKIGMTVTEYKKVMNNEWKDVTDYKNKPVKITVDTSKTLSYANYVSILKKLSRYDGVYLYEIGKSTNGRIMYSIEVDVKSKKDKKVIMLTGQTHSREFAGGVFILKQLTDLVQKAQIDNKTMLLLQSYKYVAVPIISLDVREGLIYSPSSWIQGGQLWKAYANGTDGNRNYPGLQWGEVSIGNTTSVSIAKKPGYGKYMGTYAGSATETKAMMKWFYQYVVVEQAVYHLDYHQQGSLIYAGKPWQTKAQENRCITFATKLKTFFNAGNFRRYNYIKESASYGLQGEGSTATDFSVSLAVGAKFSPQYGFMVFSSNGKEYTLMEIRDLDTTKVKIKEANNKFATATIEIGYGTSYLGNSTLARQLITKEYKAYHYSSLLETIPTFIK